MKLDILTSHIKGNKTLYKLLSYVLVIIIVNVALPALMSVFNVSHTTYINYLLFLNAMYIFFIILPRKIHNF